MGGRKSEVECVGRARVNVSSYSRIPTEHERQFYGDLIRRLKSRREELGFSQRELDDRLGIADGIVAKWETFARLPSSFMLACWCGALKVTLIPIGPE